MTHFPRPWCKYARERHEGGRQGDKERPEANSGHNRALPKRRLPKGIYGDEEVAQILPTAVPPGGLL